jgi:hypothetical protein
MMRLRTGRPGVQIPAGALESSLVRNVEPVAGAYRASDSVGTGVNLLWVKRPGREVDSCPRFVKVRIDYICTSAVPVCIHGVAGDNFLFIFEKVLCS